MRRTFWNTSQIPPSRFAGLQYPRCPRVQDSAKLAELTLTLDKATRRQVCRSVARNGRRDVAALLVDPLVTRGARVEIRALVGLLDWSHAERLVDELPVREMPWLRLASAHPDEVLAWFRAGMDENPVRTELLWGILSPCIKGLLRARTEAMFSLLQDHPPRQMDCLRSAIGGLIRLGTPAVDLLVLDEGRLGWLRLGDTLRDAFRTLSDADLARLACWAATREGPVVELLRALPPSRRAALWSAVKEANPRQTWSVRVLAWLPHTERHAEARRMRNNPEVREDPPRHRELASWLPLDEALSVLVPDGRPSERLGTERALTWGHWLRAVGRERRGLSDTLAASSFLRNEQDPVRLAFITALSEIPVNLIEDEHLPAIDALCVAVMEARDTSWATRRRMVQLAERLLATHADNAEGAHFQTALGILERNQARGNGIVFPRLDRLRRGSEHTIVRALIKWLDADAERERPGTTLGLARALGKRARNVPELQELLGKIALTGKRLMRGQAISLWLTPAETRDVRTRRVLDHDESAITVNEVWEHVARKRQEWLDPFLDGRKLRGSWGSKKAGWVPREPTACQRWLPRQQHQLANTYQRFISDRDQNEALRAAQIRALARLPVVGVEDLRPWIDHEFVMLKESALGALVWLDEPGPSLPILLENLEGDRARVAMYAFPRLARFTPADQLDAVLQEILDRPRIKATVHKEAVRLLGANGTNKSAALLRREWERPQVHRDVRLALMHAAARRLDEDWAWEVLGAAAVDPNKEVAGALGQFQVQTTAKVHQARLCSLKLSLHSHPAEEVRRALAASVSWGYYGLAGIDPAGSAEAMAHLVKNEGAGSSVVPKAIDALAVVSGLCDSPHFLQQTIRWLLTEDDDAPIVARDESEMDRPAARRLELMVRGICDRFFSRPLELANSAKLVAAELENRPRWVPERAALIVAIATASPDPAAQIATLVGELPSVHFERALGDLVARRFTSTRLEWTVERAESVLDALVERPGSELTALSGAAQRLGWAAPFRNRIARLRDDPRVAALARQVVVTQ